MAVLGAGTGLGQAFMLWSAPRTATGSSPPKAGHVDLPARTPLEHGLVHFLTNKYGRVSCERVLSGKGLVDVFTFLSEEPACRGLIRPETAAVLATPGPATIPPPPSPSAAMAGADPVCEMALAIFCSVLGATAGNLGLMVLATGGVYIAGGIAPASSPILQRGGFREAFDRKGRLHTLVERIPAYVVTHAQPGLLGAARSRQAGQRIASLTVPTNAARRVISEIYAAIGGQGRPANCRCPRVMASGPHGARAALTGSIPVRLESADYGAHARD